ncbi:hypothetical protein F5B22DRAFT_652717 [Xylaria bambusicola]|uniref:uncharacterized protein n=1 Tax=Xylaria bambusicola TaxID=326684 RepID=UPI0020078FFE|nr:uncharacterized protein F5B22DRAFT_652717 [Xylaria bambusicola]KAI0502807.1 hypothetical protein F5B22DRAFT_652717 [Xylaria bambusicola]
MPVSAQGLQRTAKGVELQLRYNFAGNPAWELEKVLGNGAFGITVLLVDKDPLHIRRDRNRRRRRIVLKRQLASDRGMTDFLTEMRALEELRGHAHIAQIIDSTVDTQYFRSRSGRTAEFLRRILRSLTNHPENIFKAVAHHRGPAILLEYLEGGSLYTFARRQYETNTKLPNRILWNIYYCMMRACAAMTYAKNAPHGGPLELEELQKDEPHLLLRHNDIAFRNMMFDDYEPEIPEHNAIPKLVLIDFGLAGYVKPEGITHARAGEIAETYNMHQCAQLMVTLIHPHAQLAGNMYAYIHDPPLRTQAWEIIPDRHGNDHFRWVDNELRYLLCEALGDLQYRPSLQQMLRRTRRGAGKPASAYGARAPDESDLACQGILQLLQHTPDPLDNPDIF